MQILRPPLTPPVESTGLNCFTELGEVIRVFSELSYSVILGEPYLPFKNPDTDSFKNYSLIVGSEFHKTDSVSHFIFIR